MERPIDAFFKEMLAQRLALTFNDVRLRTAHAEITPDDVGLETRFSRNVGLKIPLVSAAMDKITEYPMGIAMALGGGLGIIHRYLTPMEQAAHVARVKGYLGALIREPKCVSPGDTMGQIVENRRKHSWTFHSFPVVDEGRLVGLLTKNKFDFCVNKRQTLVRDAMIALEVLVMAPVGTTLDEAYKILSEHKMKALPLVDEQGMLRGMYVWSDVMNVINGPLPAYNIDGQNRLRVGAAVGIGEEALQRAQLLMAEGVDVIVLEMSHGDSALVISTFKAIKNAFRSVDVVVGNISEGESAKNLAEAGVDGIRIGQGGGSICSTRQETGIGCPQVTAVHQCEKAIRGSGIPISSDGGIVHVGDIVIALAAGADSVTLGFMFAGTDETPGEVLTIQGQKVKLYRGMGSKKAMLDNSAAMERYQTGGHIFAEGVEAYVPYKGSVSEVIAHCVLGVQKGIFYAGADSIKKLHDVADFHRITPAGRDESQPHDVSVINETPALARRY